MWQQNQESHTGLQGWERQVHHESAILNSHKKVKTKNEQIWTILR